MFSMVWIIIDIIKFNVIIGKVLVYLLGERNEMFFVKFVMCNIGLVGN